MRRAGVGRGSDAVYHVVSRVCGREFLLTDVEKEAFRGLLGRVAGFCGVEVITFALLDNHFHLLIEVPGRVGDLSDGELLQRASLLYGKERRGQPLSMARIQAALSAGGEVREAMRKLLMGRMASLAMFMKILKQRYSIRFNRRYDRVGTLWEGRFRSVLVENSRAALRAVGAYIDLNPVRAGRVSDPKDYRFSGYGEAIGSGEANGYPLWPRIAKYRDEAQERIAAHYREYLYVAGSDPRKGRSFDADEVEAVRRRKGDLTGLQSLICRLRYMTEGAVIGTKGFVAEWMRERQAHSGTRKRSQPTLVHGLDNDLYAGSPRV
ncbi:MAG: transposase [Opitutales bacterium]|nr:transposase [Opitutales bacterium]